MLERILTRCDVVQVPGVEIGPCWLSTYALRSDGYTAVQDGGRNWLTHRMAYGLLVGPIPQGAELDHLCRARHCFCPEHLEPVTHQQNMARGVWKRNANAEKTHCPQGHAYTVRADGKRRCLTCHRLGERRRKDLQEMRTR